MIVTVKDLLQNSNIEDFEKISFTRDKFSPDVDKEIKELEKQLKEREKELKDSIKQEEAEE